MIGANVQINEQQLRDVKRFLRDIPRGLPKVMSRAINKRVTAEKTALARNISKHLNLKQKDIKARNISFKRASYRKWRGWVGISGAQIPLTYFGARQTKKGVSYKIRKGGGRMKIRSAFITRMRSGHEGVFLRRGKARLPIDEKKGPSIPHVVEDEQMIRQAKVNRALEKEIYRQVNVLIEQEAKKRGG